MIKRVLIGQMNVDADVFAKCDIPGYVLDFQRQPDVEYNVFFPVTEEEVMIMDPSPIPVFAPSPEVTKQLRYKDQFYLLVSKLGLDQYVPKTWLPSQYADDERLFKKKIDGVAGIGCSYIKGPIKVQHDYIVQEAIYGKNCTVYHMSVVNGIILGCIKYANEEFRPNYIKRGRVKKYKSTVIDPTDDELFFFQRLFKELNYTGIVCSDVKWVGGKMYVFEVNARPGGSLFHNAKDAATLIKLGLDELLRSNVNQAWA